jgi:hypothetical protein
VAASACAVPKISSFKLAAVISAAAPTEVKEMSKTKRHKTIHQTHPAVPPDSPPAKAAASTAELPDELQKIQKLLDSDRPEEALKIAVGRGSGGPLHANARAVCLMRLGRPEEAVKVLRPVAVEGGGVFLHTNAPLAAKINFATALALSGNPQGTVGVLNEIEQEDNLHVQVLREAIRRWEKELSLWEWIQWKGGVSISKPVSLDSPPGTLT